MLDAMERIFTEYEEGRLSRRQALGRIGALVGALAAAGAATAVAEERSSTFVARGLNHIALRVGDLARSREFYERHLGMKTTSVSEWSCFMDCGDGHFVALFRGEKPGLDHYCYTIDRYDPDDVVKRLREAGLEPHREQNRVYFDDPDGLTVQLAAKR